MCGEELVRVEQHTRVNVTVAVADATVGYGQFKRVAKAVRVANVRVVVSEERRTVGYCAAGPAGGQLLGR